MKKQNNSEIEESFKQGSGNVFLDLGLPHPEEDLAKAELALRINSIIRKKRLNQTEAAKILGVHQPRVSDLINGKISKFTLDNLVEILNKLDWDVVITTKHKPSSRAYAKTLVRA